MWARAHSWAKNCAPNAQTNGVDYKNTGEMEKLVKRAPHRARKMAKANRIDKQKVAVGLPSQFEPKIPKLNGSEDVIKSYILPDGKTGVVRMRRSAGWSSRRIVSVLIRGRIPPQMFVSSFEPSDANTFMADVQTAFTQFKSKGVSQLLLDLTNNGGAHIGGSISPWGGY